MSFRVKIRHLFILAVAVLCVILPWTVRNIYVSGHFVPVSTNMGVNLLIGHEPDATGQYRNGADYWSMMEAWSDDEQDPVLRNKKVAQVVAAHMLSQPLRTIELGVRKIILLWSPVPAGEAFGRQIISLVSSGPLLLFGLWAAWRQRGAPVGWGALTLALALTFVHALFFAHTRFRLPIDLALIAPVACLLAGQEERDESA